MTTVRSSRFCRKCGTRPEPPAPEWYTLLCRRRTTPQCNLLRCTAGMVQHHRRPRLWPWWNGYANVRHAGQGTVGPDNGAVSKRSQQTSWRIYCATDVLHVERGNCSWRCIMAETSVDREWQGILHSWRLLQSVFARLGQASPPLSVRNTLLWLIRMGMIPADHDWWKRGKITKKVGLIFHVFTSSGPFTQNWVLCIKISPNILQIVS